ncbi:DedA family protein [Peterkaempfera sp. SMS 1(5)a]|uniref:DedA family protein n=1 Tax=Peterkaempfera podocarpi TaxID=3232308 RepID=UPI00366DFBCB
MRVHLITDWLNDLGGAPAYGAVALLVFCEVAVPFGFLLPGETSVVLGGVLAQRDRTSIALVAAVAVGAAVIGDSTAYLIGRLTADRIRTTRPAGRGAQRLRRAGELMDRHGAAAVFFGRFIPFVRSAMPLLAGSSRMPYARFLLFDALAALLWGTGSALLGYAAGAAWNRVAHALGGSLLALAAVAAVALLAVRMRRRHRRVGTGPRPGPDPGPPYTSDGTRKDTDDRPDPHPPHHRP